jgi:hypothetical protein
VDRGPVDAGPVVIELVAAGKLAPHALVFSPTLLERL